MTKKSEPIFNAETNPAELSPVTSTKESRAVFAKLPPPYYASLVATFVATMLISNICATKGVVIGPLNTDGAFYLFPLAYVIGDVISEVYGFKAMRRAVGIGLALVLLASACFLITIYLPAASFYSGQEAFEDTLGLVYQIFIGSILGYLAGELLNSYVLVKIKKRTGERHLWVRLLGSTVVGEFFDTLIFCSVAASVIGIETWSDLINYTVVGFLWKTAVELLMMPVTYRVVAIIKRREPSYQLA